MLTYRWRPITNHSSRDYLLCVDLQCGRLQSWNHVRSYELTNRPDVPRRNNNVTYLLIVVLSILDRKWGKWRMDRWMLFCCILACLLQICVHYIYNVDRITLITREFCFRWPRGFCFLCVLVHSRSRSYERLVSGALRLGLDFINRNETLRTSLFAIATRNLMCPQHLYFLSICSCMF